MFFRYEVAKNAAGTVEELVIDELCFCLVNLPHSPVGQCQDGTECKIEFALCMKGKIRGQECLPPNSYLKVSRRIRFSPCWDPRW